MRNKENTKRLKIIIRINKYSSVYTADELIKLSLNELNHIQNTALIKLNISVSFRMRHLKH